MKVWQGSFLINDWLRDIHVGDGKRPPQQVGVYVISVKKWIGIPTIDCLPLYVGGQTSAVSSIRRRLGQWICDSFGFFHEDDVGNTTIGTHSGAQSLFKWCRKNKTSLLDLYIGWTTDGCFRCLECDVYDELLASGMLLNKKRPGKCDLQHTNMR